MRSAQVIYLPKHCPHHKFCAYTGLEQDRCPDCHSTFIDDICSCMQLPPGRTRPCFCDACGELFTGPSSFDQHQRPTGVCRNPQKRGLVLIEQNGWSLWAKPGSHDWAEAGV
jgi:hypothetical protein